MSTEIHRHHQVCCFGHLFKAVFLISLITIILNIVHVFMAIKNHDLVHLPGLVASILCYVCVVIGQTLWLHQFFYPEFIINAISLPIKFTLAVILLLHSTDQLGDEVEHLYPARKLTKGLFHTLRACFLLAVVIYEIYVFRLCQKAHLLMRRLTKEEGQRCFDVKRYITAKDILDNMPTQNEINIVRPIELKVVSKLEQKSANNRV
ncbi:hypothetical protein M3Y98_01175000 [Aphelenchoides besseyi]|nr:hypothetical protein M3Y98_01175000 [Aphelenchoides besseyi]KAI6211009.1 hypothetical protein M3Y96_00388000 [Aphelenchoides besseyi]